MFIINISNFYLFSINKVLILSTTLVFFIFIFSGKILIFHSKFTLFKNIDFYNFNSKEIDIPNIKKYINLCNKISFYLLKKITFKFIINPKVSIVIPIFNAALFIKRILNSINYQYFLNLEILFVNDFSSDNSIDFIKYYMKKDGRIRIINNKKNFGILYSKRTGVYFSKGKFLLLIDQDDYFLPNIIQKCLSIYNSYDVDFIEFKEIWEKFGRYKYHSLHFNKNTKFNKSYSYINLIQGEDVFNHLTYDEYGKEIFHCLIWNKFYKTKIIKDAYNLISNNILKQHINIYEDNIALFFIYKKINSIIILNEFGYFASNNPKSETRKKYNQKKIDEIGFNSLIYLNYILNYVNDIKKYKYLIKKLKDATLLRNHIFSKINKNINYGFKLANKIKNNKYFTIKDNKKLNLFLNDLKKAKKKYN